MYFLIVKDLHYIIYIIYFLRLLQILYFSMVSDPDLDPKHKSMHSNRCLFEKKTYKSWLRTIKKWKRQQFLLNHFYHRIDRKREWSGPGPVNLRLDPKSWPLIYLIDWSDWNQWQLTMENLLHKLSQTYLWILERHLVLVDTATTHKDICQGLKIRGDP